MKSGAYILYGKGEFYSITSIIHCYSFNIKFWQNFKTSKDTLGRSILCFSHLSDYEITKWTCRCKVINWHL